MWNCNYSFHNYYCNFEVFKSFQLIVKFIFFAKQSYFIDFDNFIAIYSIIQLNCSLIGVKAHRWKTFRSKDRNMWWAFPWIEHGLCRLTSSIKTDLWTYCRPNRSRSYRRTFQIHRDENGHLLKILHLKQTMIFWLKFGVKQTK